MKEYRIKNFIADYDKSLMSPDWAEKLKENPIDLIKEKKDNTIEEIKEKYSGKVAVLDLYIKDIEKRGSWNREDKIFLQVGDMVNIDHHAPIKEFSKNISSTNLAIEWVNKNGVLGKDYSVMINHTDCDSVLSSLIIRGVLPPDEKFGEAAVAADHTGEENEIADLLQAVESKRDLEFSARNLKLLFEKKPLEPHAQDLMKERDVEREKAIEIVNNGEFKKMGGVAYVQLDKKIESSFFPALIPDAQVILSFSPLGEDSGLWEVKIRLGMGAARVGVTLDDLKIKECDPNFGCRWNAGSNRKAGGTSLSIEEYVEFLNERLQEYLKNRKQ